jgi:exopolyphosphatase/guanosine-5'-triphosphate,3'-diphosphate pyrophosphatase
MFAAVDLGSNSFRFAVGTHDGASIRILRSVREPIRLAAGLDASGHLTDATCRTALACLRGFRAQLANFELDAVRVVATAVLRQARNAAAFTAEAEAALGYPVEIISGEEEGRLIYMGVANTIGLPGERRLVVDIGGGSTELVLGQGVDIDKVESFSVGSVKQSLAFFPDGRIDATSFEAAVLSARGQFEDAAPPYHPDNWKRAYGSSGTIRAIADVIQRNDIGRGRIDLSSLQALRQRFIEAGNTSLVNLSGLRPERAATVAGGLAILIALFQQLQIGQMGTVDAGLRLGVLWDLYHRSQSRDRRDEAIGQLATRFGVDHDRAMRTAHAASALFAQLRPGGESYTKLLYWAGVLHEAGLAVSQTGYHKHSAYLAEHADLPGFTAREQKILGRLLAAQKGNLRKVEEFLSDHDFAKAVLSLRLALILLHARLDGEVGAIGLRLNGRIELELPQYLLDEHPTLRYWVDREHDWWDEVETDFKLRLRG